VVHLLRFAGLQSGDLVTVRTVLVVDDDATHLKLYSWILERGGFRPLQARVRGDRVDLPASGSVDVIALDYRLNSRLTAVDVAQQLKEKYPDTPILVLSDMMWMPADIAPLASAFVSKGDPEILLKMVTTLASGKTPLQKRGQAEAT
jgi:CheY-like chemotaxis protein